MNALVVGSNKEPLLRYLPNKFLLIDDGAMIDALPFRARKFDPAKHSFSPLKDMSYRKARDFIDVLNAVFPEGENTLTKRNSNFVLLNALLSDVTKLDKLIPAPDKKDTGALDAWQKIQTLLLSPVLKRVLNTSMKFGFDGTIAARIDRAKLGRFDSFVLGNLLISQYPGTVVIPDFGFYACPFHQDLILQGRLVAGINSFDEVPKLRNDLLMIEQKTGSRCTPKDAEILATYAGIPPGTNAYADFIERNIA